MALAHARKIKVGQHTFQWKISPRGGMHLAVFHIPSKTKWVCWMEDKTIVTPRMVREYIEKMLIEKPIQSGTCTFKKDHVKPKIYRPNHFNGNHNHNGC